MKIPFQRLLAALRPFAIGVIPMCLLLSACTSDKEDIRFPDDPYANCDTTAVSFAADIHPILSAQCSSCHSLSAASDNVVLELYSDVLPYAQAGTLVEVVEFDSQIKMPQTGKLPLCDIAKIRSWVREGALDN